MHTSSHVHQFGSLSHLFHSSAVCSVTRAFYGALARASGAECYAITYIRQMFHFAQTMHNRPRHARLFSMHKRSRHIRTHKHYLNGILGLVEVAVAAPFAPGRHGNAQKFRHAHHTQRLYDRNRNYRHQNGATACTNVVRVNATRVWTDSPAAAAVANTTRSD